MNSTTPYEQLVASKLDQVPVPDMADSIWASIEMQLDVPADAPGEGSGDGSADAPMGKKPFSAGKGIALFGLAAVVAVIALLWWYYGHKGHAPVNVPAAPRALPAPATQAPPPVAPPRVAPSTVEPPAPVKKSIPVIPGAIKKDTVLFHAPPKDSVRVDSVVKQIPSPVKIDSSFLQKNRVPAPDDDPGYIPLAPRPKKPKGVKGITSDDYKISAGKDSGRKKN